jgi:hypothetical protein
MALKDDDKKKALAAAAKSSSTKSAPTMSGKPAYKTGGSNPLGTRKVGTTSMPPAKTKAVSPVMVKESKPVGRDASGSANFNRTAPARATITAGPAKLPVGGKTTKSTGGINYSKGDVLPPKQDNSTAKSGPAKVISPTTKYTGYKDTNSVPLAVAGGLATAGAGVVLSGAGKKIAAGAKKLVKYVANTKERRAARKQQNADNEAFIAERKAKAEAKNPSTPVAKVKASKRTKDNMKRLKKQ